MATATKPVRKRTTRRVFADANPDERWGFIPTSKMLLKLAIYAWEHPNEDFVFPHSRDEARALHDKFFGTK